MTESGSTSAGWESFFDVHAPQYDENVFVKNTAAEADFVLDVFGELGLEAGASILDVGCGTGRHSIALAKRGYRMTGIDLSNGMLSIAAAAAVAADVSVVWIQADATRFEVDTPLDAAICLCEGAFGLLGEGDDSLEHPAAILRNVRASVHPGAPVLFTVLNGYARIRNATPEDVESGRFDPRTMVEAVAFPPRDGHPPIPARERSFLPTELTLLFGAAGFEVLHIWGGTAGNWGRRPIDLDEIELMVVARAH